MPGNKDTMPEELITPEMVESFIAESTDLLDNTERSLLEMERAPLDNKLIADSFRAIHTVKGNAGFFGFAEIERMCMDIESVMDSIRKGLKKADNNTVSALLASVDSLRRLVGTVGSKMTPSSTGGNAVKEKPDDSFKNTTSYPETDKLEEGEYMPIGEMLIKMGVVSEEVIEKALDIQNKKIGELLLEEGATTREEVEKALSEQGKMGAVVSDQESSYTVKRKDIRVDTEKLDKLFDLMGELITAEAMVVNHPELEGLEIDNFHRAAGSMSKITRAMQEITMAIRMIPLDGLFNKMRRLVRDLSRKFDKKINLIITGQDTEMDRSVMEEISDPLIHIIRNAIDHGIEDCQERIKKGKDESGLIQLDAKYEGNEIWITITDDGAGLNKEKILRKAEKNGLITGSGADMSDRDIWQLIFEPGFSTAEKVSEISGRGVGMDVVRRNMEKLRGKVDISSVMDKETQIILKIPLTLAIVDGITFKIGTLLYSIPITDVVEFQKVGAHQVTRTRASEEVLRLRSEIIPVIRLYDFFKIENAKTDISHGIFIIVQAAGKRAALMVDEIIGYKQVVIKPLPEYIGRLRALSGLSILGNGEVSLIIDTGSLIKEKLE
ncbi:MAG: chemotaxis protein CheA [Spirochaetota bacterium]